MAQKQTSGAENGSLWTRNTVRKSPQRDWNDVSHPDLHHVFSIEVVRFVRQIKNFGDVFDYYNS